MSVRYKFKDEKRWKTIAFDSAVISVLDLKRAIVQQLKELNPDEDTNTNMIFTNAQTGERYVAENFLIPKNTAVDVRKVPGSAEVISRIHEPTVVTILSQNRPATIVNDNHETASGADDEMRRLEEVLNQSSYSTGVRHNRPGLLADLASAFEAPAPALAASITGPSHVRRPHFARTGRPRPGYICHRCQMPGHFIQDCPTNGNTEFNFQRPKPGTGIPLSMLKPVEAGQGAYRLEDGTYANIEPNHRAFNEAFSAHDRAEQKIAMENALASAEDLTCQMCKKLYDDPTVTNCCYTTFCRACIISNPNCPICQEPITDIDELNRNTTLAQRVEEFVQAQGTTRSLSPIKQAGAQPKAQLQPQQRAPIPIFQSAPRQHLRRQQQTISAPTNKDESFVRPVEVKQRHIMDDSQPQANSLNHRNIGIERHENQERQTQRLEEERRIEEENRREQERRENERRRDDERRREEGRRREEERRRNEEKRREEQRRREDEWRRAEDRRRKEEELRQVRDAERRRFQEHRFAEDRRRDEERRRVDERRFQLERCRIDEARRRELDDPRAFAPGRHREHRDHIHPRHERGRSRSPISRRRDLPRPRR